MASRVTPEQIPFQSKKYEWLEYLGGNMADVYLAREIRTEREVIIKVLKTEYCAETEMQLRFAQEARLACRCQHPNIVTSYYADEEDGRPYIAMENLRGDTLRELIKRGGIETQEQAVWIGLQLAMALNYLQAAQIVHRDLKPDNVVVDASGCAKLLDFGVARLKDSRLTEFGVRIGTLKYMSPEQVKSDPLTFSSDMYAFGVLLFEMLTSQLPYEAESMEDYFGAILRNEPKLDLLHAAKVPDELIALIKCCLEKECGRRFSSFAEICATLRRYVQPARLEQFPQTPVEAVNPPQAAAKSVWPLVGAGLAVLVLLAAGIGFWITHRPANPARTLTLATGDMVLVNAGAALLGSDAKPVNVNAFYIDVTEVTNAAYLVFCRETGRSMPKESQTAGDYPVVNVTFNDAQAFAQWAHKRLPTATEWEKAARGVSGQKFPWGNEWRADAANIPRDKDAVKNGAAHLAPAKSLSASASPYGALNLVGNVWEWVSTPVIADDREIQVMTKLLPKDFSPPLSPTEPFYQTKGGSFSFLVPKGSEAALVFDQRAMPARAHEAALGFRCAKDL